MLRIIDTAKSESKIFHLSNYVYRSLFHLLVIVAIAREGGSKSPTLKIIPKFVF